MIIAFLDLLGFSNLIENDLFTARDNLSIFNDVLRTKVIDAKCHPVSEYNEKNGLRNFAENSAVTSFNYLISISDSLIIGANNPDLFVRQLSNFVSTIFIDYTEPFEKPFENIDSVTTNQRGEWIINSDGKGKFFPYRSFPLLFRGGITYGDDVSFNKEGSIWNNEYQLSGVNVSGLSYVRAVKLESSDIGPRLFCDKKFVEKLCDIDVKRSIRCLKNDLYEIVWTYFGCEAAVKEGSVMRNAYKRIESFFLPRAINLYSYYCKIESAKDQKSNSESRICQQYDEFIKLICRGILQYVSCNGKPDDVSRIIKIINEKLENIGNKYIWRLDCEELKSFLG